MSLVSLPIILYFIPQISKNRISEEAETEIRMHQLEPIQKLGDYSYIYRQQDYIVKKLDGSIDTIGICLHKGEIMLTGTTDYKKTLPGKIFGF
jgi:hypothetical protein